jgi:hypothetical protein
MNQQFTFLYQREITESDFTGPDGFGHMIQGFQNGNWIQEENTK